MDIDPYLVESYRSTTFRVFLNNDAVFFDLKISQINKNFDEWCQGLHINSWSIITAENPISRKLSRSENQKKTILLRQAIVDLHFDFMTAIGIPADEKWEAENSFFIPNITADEAKTLGSRFQQNAVVFGGPFDAPNLIWCLC